MLQRGCEPGTRIPILEAETRVLRQWRVVDLEGRACRVEILQRGERLAGPHIVQNGMTMRERAALGVLSRQPDRDALDQERAERQRLRLAPVDSTILDRLKTAVELAFELRVHGEVLRDDQQLLAQFA